MNFRVKILLLQFFLSSIISAQTNPKHIWVQPHYSKGKQIEGYWKTSPNSTNRDNFSTKGNYNPYTGKAGWIEPDNKWYYYDYSNTSTNTDNVRSYSASKQSIIDFFNEPTKPISGNNKGLNQTLHSIPDLCCYNEHIAAYNATSDIKYFAGIKLDQINYYFKEGKLEQILLASWDPEKMHDLLILMAGVNPNYILTEGKDFDKLGDMYLKWRIKDIEIEFVFVQFIGLGNIYIRNIIAKNGN